jgi:hypothetical protein
MARLSNKRRRELRLKLERQAVAKDLNPSMLTDVPYGYNRDGNKTDAMRSSHRVAKLHEAVGVPLSYRKPKSLNFEGAGVKGKIVRGKVVPTNAKPLAPATGRGGKVRW